MGQKHPPLPQYAVALSVIAAALVTCSRPPESDVHGVAVVLIVVDTLRADHLGLYGYRRPTSPALDDWAKEGSVFERSFATSPWTLPTFGSLYTGLLPTRHGAGTIVPEKGAVAGRPVGHFIIHGEKKSFAGLDTEVPTLAEILRTHGYVTGAVVNNPFLHPILGVARGFQDYDYVAGSDHQMRRADVMVERALAWIADHAEQPFFLLLHLFDPHMNYDAPFPFRGRFTSRLPSRFSVPVHDTQAIRDSAAMLTAPDRAFIKAAYDEEVAFVDQQIGRFLTALKRQGLLRRTLVILTSDHGEELFEHDGFGHGHTMYDELLRVPLLAWGSAVRAARLPTPVSLVDIAPTILDAAGLRTTVAMEGVSLWPALTGDTEPPPRPLFAERPGTGPERKSVIQWPYKLIAGPDGRLAQLFDLSGNADQAIDQTQSSPELRDALMAKIRETFPREPAGHKPVAPKLDDAMREKLHRLGYLE